jgi:small subunit ribosomal protein S21
MGDLQQSHDANMWRGSGRVKPPKFLCFARDASQRPVAVLDIVQEGGHCGPAYCVHGWREAPVQVLVRDNNVDQALRALKNKMQREGVFREMKLRRNYEKPSERRAREKAEAVRRYRKLLRKRMEREGY